MSESCNFQRGTWECRGDGYLWDADSDGYDPEDTGDPCPCCNTLEYLTQAKEEAETCSRWLDMYGAGTGETIWLRRLALAKQANQVRTDEVLKEIGPVHALVYDPDSPDGFFVSINNID